MLSPTAFLVLADRNKVPPPALRVLFALCATHDLRVVRVVDARAVRKICKVSPVQYLNALDHLVAAGILERGASIKVEKKLNQKPRLTFRIRRAYLMQEEDKLLHFAEVAALQERMTLAVPVS